MKAPRQPRGKWTQWIPPDKEWLEYHYIQLNKPASTIGAEFGIPSAGGMVNHWLKSVGIETRPPGPLRGHLSPHWKGGHSKVYQKKCLRRTGVPEVCAWCGTSKRVELHHRDHNRRNGALENLQWLCFFCNRLEMALWHLNRLGIINLVAEYPKLVITFKRDQDA